MVNLKGVEVFNIMSGVVSNSSFIWIEIYYFRDLSGSFCCDICALSSLACTITALEESIYDRASDEISVLCGFQFPLTASLCSSTSGLLVRALGELLGLSLYEGISKSFRTGRVERELQMVQLCATRSSYIAIL
jgi:hypothetical protein